MKCLVLHPKLGVDILRILHGDTRGLSAFTALSGTKMYCYSPDQSGCLRPRSAVPRNLADQVNFVLRSSCPVLEFLHNVSIPFLILAGSVMNTRSRMLVFSMLTSMAPFDFIDDILQRDFTKLSISFIQTE